MSERKESEFLSKVGEFAKATGIEHLKKGEKKGMIILASEKVSEDQSMNLNATFGDGEVLANAIAQFLSNEKYFDLVSNAISIIQRNKAEKAVEQFVNHVKNN